MALQQKNRVCAAHVGNNFFETFDGSPSPTSAAWPARFIIPSAKIHMTAQGAEAERNAAITPPTEQIKLAFRFVRLVRELESDRPRTFLVRLVRPEPTPY